MQRRLSLCAAALAAAAAAFAVYRPSLRNGFVWDDHIYIEGNPFVARPANYKELLSRRFWTTTDERVPDAARPVFVLSLLADRAMWGENPRGYHLTNVLLHAANSALVAPVALAALPPPAAIMAALVFAVHPANSEAVELPSFRPDLLAAFFVLAALWLHWSWRRRKSPLLAAAGLAGCALLYGLGLLSKEMAITFPALAVALEQAAWPRGEKRRAAWLAAALAVYGGVAAGYLLWRAPRSGYAALTQARPAPRAAAPLAAAAKPTPQEPPQELRTFPPSQPQWQPIYKDRRLYVLTMTGVLGQEWRVLAFGRPLRADRAPILIDSASSPRVWLVWLALALVAAGTLAAWRASHRAPALALAWVLLAWVPVSNVVPLYNPIAERYLYLISVGTAIALGWAFSMAARWRGAPAVAALLLACYSLGTWRRAADWRSDETLFGREAALATGNARVYYNLGVQARDRSDEAGAESYFRKAIAMNPRYVEARTNLAALLCRQKKTAACVALLRQAVSQSPTSYIPYLALGQALTQADRAGEALAWYEKAYDSSNHLDRASAIGLASSSLAAGRDYERALAALRGLLAAAKDDAEARNLFALISWRLGRVAIAASAASGVIVERQPTPAPASLDAMARLLQDEGDKAGAAAAYSQALQADPSDKAANLQLAIMELEVKRYDLALELLKKADPKDPLTLVNTGVCLHHLGRLPEAETALEHAVSLDGTRAPFYYDLGAAYLDDPARLSQAAAALRKAASLSPDYADAWYNLGVAMLKLDRKDDALRDFQKVLSLDPKKLEALNNAAAILIEKGERAQAGQLLQRALAVVDHPSIHNNMGELLMSERRFQQASLEFKKAIQSTARVPDNMTDLSRYFQNLSAAYAAMGQSGPAADADRQARAPLGTP